MKNTRPTRRNAAELINRRNAGNIKNVFLRILYALALTAGTVACGQHRDYDARGLAQISVALTESTTLSYQYFPRALRTDERVVGKITLTTSEEPNNGTSVFIRQIPHGYAAETPLSDKEFPVYLSVGKDNESDYFAGLRFRINF